MLNGKKARPPENLPGYNTRLAKLAVQYYIDKFVVNQKLVLCIKMFMPSLGDE
jgi:hypothetical protein